MAMAATRTPEMRGDELQATMRFCNEGAECLLSFTICSIQQRA
jgi:hypothetical protein